MNFGRGCVIGYKHVPIVFVLLRPFENNLTIGTKISICIGEKVYKIF